jgi:hypothetical protein
MAPPEEHCCVRHMSFLDYVGKWPGMRQSRDEGMLPMRVILRAQGTDVAYPAPNP